MCTFKNNNRMRKPKTETFIAYKVFEVWGRDMPYNYTGLVEFKFGVNTWDKSKAFGSSFAFQSGFQMFANKKDALTYSNVMDAVCEVVVNTNVMDAVCEVVVNTKDIRKMGKVQTGRQSASKAYEAIAFELRPQDWAKKIIQNRLRTLT